MTAPADGCKFLPRDPIPSPGECGSTGKSAEERPPPRVRTPEGRCHSYRRLCTPSLLPPTAARFNSSPGPPPYPLSAESCSRRAVPTGRSPVAPGGVQETAVGAEGQGGNAGLARQLKQFFLGHQVPQPDGA